MFESNDKKKAIRESMLEKLIEDVFLMKDPSDEEAPSEEVSEAGEEMKPKMEMEVMKVEAKPKEKFMGPNGEEMEDESIEDLLERKKQKA